MTTLTQNNCSNICAAPITSSKKNQVTIFTTLQIWHDRYISRKHLRALEPHMLSDIGVNYEDAQIEAAIPFWRAK